MFSLATVKIITKVKCLLEAIIDNQVEEMHSRQSRRSTLLILSHRLLGTIFQLFVREKLGYKISLVEPEPAITSTDMVGFSSCQNEL